MKVNNFLTASVILVIVAAVYVTSVPNLSFSKEERQESEVMNEIENGDDVVEKEEVSGLSSDLTEWTGMAGLGMAVGLALPILINRSSNNDVQNRKYFSLPTETLVFVLIAVLSITVGIVHFLLIDEHMKESYMWGVGFLVMGISQMTYGIIMIFAKKLSSGTKRILYEIGITGNSLFVVIFVYARLFVPPFSPEEAPVSEIESNGIITLVIQLLIIGLLIYATRNTVKEQANKIPQ
ncbi:MAG: hypothetical protein ACRD4J_03395 [Nitrososphaeraceae archaeon]